MATVVVRCAVYEDMSMPNKNDEKSLYERMSVN